VNLELEDNSMPGKNRALLHILSQLRIKMGDIKHISIALTHPSYYVDDRVKARLNQRLEFLGDAVIDLTISEYLFRHYPEADEGTLTILKSNIVSKTKLARCGRKIGLEDTIRVGKSVRSKGRINDRIIAQIFESLTGAIFLSYGLGKASDYVLYSLKDEIAQVRNKCLAELEPRGTLQMLVERKYGEKPKYITVKTDDNMFISEVFVADRCMGKARGNSKKEAEKLAAKGALTKLSYEGL